MVHDRPTQQGSMADRMTRRVALRGVSALGISALLEANGVYRVFAQEGTPPPVTGLQGVYPEVAIVAADFSFEMPASVPGGFTTLTMKNDGHVDHHAMFMRLNEGADMAELEAALTQPDPTPIFALSESIGGPVVSPGGEASVIVDLTPGQYMVICIVPEADGTPHYMLGMYAPLEVTEPASDAGAPTAEMTVDMVDFAFEMPTMEVASGPQIWEVPNVGEQIHELVVLKLEPGVTFDQVMAMLSPAPATPAAGAEASPMAMEMAPPFQAVGGVAPMHPSYANWAVLDLQPGEYVAICFVPDPETGAPHFALGMIMPFSVS
jgi:hypothetical protein